MTVPELAEPRAGNGTTRIEPSFGTGPNESPYQKRHSPVPEMVRNESRPAPVMADCRFGYRVPIGKFPEVGSKKGQLVMGASTGNGTAISSNGKYCAFGYLLTYVRTPRCFALRFGVLV